MRQTVFFVINISKILQALLADAHLAGQFWFEEADDECREIFEIPSRNPKTNSFQTKFITKVNSNKEQYIMSIPLLM
jgi:hypothetical protein